MGELEETLSETYFISDQSLFQYVDHLIVNSPTYFSDHSQILT